MIPLLWALSLLLVHADYFELGVIVFIFSGFIVARHKARTTRFGWTVDDKGLPMLIYHELSEGEYKRIRKAWLKEID